MNNLRIPGTINLIIATAATVLCASLLWLASNSTSGLVIAGAAIGFSLFNNTLFALLHESVHGVLHQNTKINYLAGLLCSAMFPTGYSIQKISHLGHHQRNRTDAELYDYYLPHQSRWLKTYWLYCLLTGFYWAIIPVAGLIFLFMPWSFASKHFQTGPARWWGFEPFVRDIAQQGRLRVWLELFFSFVIQLMLWQLLDLNWKGYLLCYWAFGLNWSALQYVDHAWSVRDVINGAWNLKVNPLVQKIFLNYHLHLAHHRHPQVPWIYLPGLVEKEDERPSFWPIYFSLWAGARPAPPFQERELR